MSRQRCGSRLPWATALLAAAIVAPAGALAADAAPEALRIQTRSGALVGVSEDGVRVFKAIPYAAPPVGPLRWAPPAPPKAWTGERKADAFGAPCAQIDGTRINQGKRVSREGVDLFYGVPMAPNASEDCLTLNLWAPATARRAPVMVFIYGGGGSADIPWWNGAAFARDGVILINFNFRNLTMGKFAHPALTKASPSGASLSRYDVMDQIAALKWVRENVAAFGGDPANVTLFGQSAGGAGVLQLLTVPSARGLFHKAIVQSGNGWWAAADQAHNERIGARLATLAGLPGADATIEQLRALPPDAMPQIGHFAFDGRLVPENPTDAIAAGRVIDVPLIIGWNDFDGSSLRLAAGAVVDKASPELKAAYAGQGKTGEDLAYTMYTDSHAGAPARWIAKRTAKGAPTYLYQVSYVLSAQRGRVRGAAHGSELPHVFDSWGKAAPNLPLTAEDKAATRMLHQCWVAFARSGTPACDGAPAWPRYSEAKDQLMEFGITPAVRQGFRKPQLDAQEAALPDILAVQREALDAVFEAAP